MKVAELVDPHPTAPTCVGGSSKQYRAFKQDGTGLLFARNNMCHSFDLPNGEGADARNVLDGLESIAQGSLVELLGTWGIPGADLTASDTGVSVVFGCSTANIPRQVFLDAQGNFELEGTVTPEGGAQPIGGYHPYPAHFSGHVHGDFLDLTISEPNGQPAPVYHFQYGAVVPIFHCA